MSDINKNELYKEFQKACMGYVQSEAIMYGIWEYSVSIKERRTDIVLSYLGHTATLIFFKSGRLIMKYHEPEKHNSGILADTVIEEYLNGKTTVAHLLGDCVDELFRQAMLLKTLRNQKRNNKRIKKRTELLKIKLQELREKSGK